MSTVSICDFCRHDKDSLVEATASYSRGGDFLGLCESHLEMCGKDKSVDAASEREHVVAVLGRPQKVIGRRSSTTRYSTPRRCAVEGCNAEPYDVVQSYRSHLRKGTNCDFDPELKRKHTSLPLDEVRRLVRP